MVLIEAWLPSDLRSWLTPAFILRSYLRPSTVLTPRSAKRAEDSSMLEWWRRRRGSEAAEAAGRRFVRFVGVRRVFEGFGVFGRIWGVQVTCGISYVLCSLPEPLEGPTKHCGEYAGALY